MKGIQQLLFLTFAAREYYPKREEAQNTNDHALRVLPARFMGRQTGLAFRTAGQKALCLRDSAETSGKVAHALTCPAGRGCC